MHVVAGAGLGGVETFIRNVAFHTDRDEVDLAVCVLGTDGPLVDALQKAGVEVDVLGLAPDASAIQRTIAIIPFVARRRADIVHLSCGRSGLRRIIRGTGAKHVISHVHGFPDEWIAGNRTRQALPLRSAYVDAATQVVACSRWTADALSDLTRATVIPYGVPIPPTVEPRRETGEIVAGFLGRLVPQKGLRYLLEAASLALGENERLRFVIAGDGPLRDEVARGGANLPEGRCRLVGECHDIDGFMRDIDLLVVPSEWEAFGIVAIEAQASERPVVGFRVDGLPEAVAADETGILVPHHDTTALADAIVRLASDDDLRRRMGAAGRKRVLSLFSAHAMVRRIGDLYAAIVGRSTPNVPSVLRRDE
jgi:glycosyltransferase involved in cell wall biosynthesis